jgi:hypothetical protein
MPEKMAGSVSKADEFFEDNRLLPHASAWATFEYLMGPCMFGAVKDNSHG